MSRLVVASVPTVSPVLLHRLVPGRSVGGGRDFPSPAFATSSVNRSENHLLTTTGMSIQLDASELVCYTMHKMSNQHETGWSSFDMPVVNRLKKVSNV